MKTLDKREKKNKIEKKKIKKISSTGRTIKTPKRYCTTSSTEEPSSASLTITSEKSGNLMEDMTNFLQSRYGITIEVPKELNETESPVQKINNDSNKTDFVDDTPTADELQNSSANITGSNKKKNSSEDCIVEDDSEDSDEHESESQGDYSELSHAEEEDSISMKSNDDAAEQTGTLNQKVHSSNRNQVNISISESQAERLAQEKAFYSDTKFVQLLGNELTRILVAHEKRLKDQSTEIINKMENYQTNVQEQCAKVIQEMEILKAKLDSMNVNGNIQPASLIMELPDFFPIKTEEDFAKFETDTELQDTLKRYCEIWGGESPEECARHILKAALSDQLAMSFKWSLQLKERDENNDNNNDKPKLLYNKQFSIVIHKAMKVRFPKISIKEFQNCMQAALRASKQRFRDRSNREKRRQSANGNQNVLQTMEHLYNENQSSNTE